MNPFGKPLVWGKRLVRTHWNLFLKLVRLKVKKLDILPRL